MNKIISGIVAVVAIALVGIATLCFIHSLMGEYVGLFYVALGLFGFLGIMQRINA